jgi:hypothetical protein
LTVKVWVPLPVPVRLWAGQAVAELERHDRARGERGDGHEHERLDADVEGLVDHEAEIEGTLEELDEDLLAEQREAAREMQQRRGAQAHAMAQA